MKEGERREERRNNEATRKRRIEASGQKNEVKKERSRSLFGLNKAMAER